LSKALGRLGKREALQVVYEAAPCGYTLARAARAGELVSVAVPDERDEALRDRSRAREDAVRARLKARQQLRAMLLRHGHPYTGRSSWTEAHERLDFHGARNFSLIGTSPQQCKCTGPIHALDVLTAVCTILCTMKPVAG
jgi:hypothetical protein